MLLPSTPPNAAEWEPSAVSQKSACRRQPLGKPFFDPDALPAFGRLQEETHPRSGVTQRRTILHPPGSQPRDPQGASEANPGKS